MSEPLVGFIHEAFKYVVAAEKMLYAGGGDRAAKDEIIKAHSALLQLTLMYPERET